MGGSPTPLGPPFSHKRQLVIFTNTLTPNLDFQGPQAIPLDTNFHYLSALSCKPPPGPRFFMHRRPNSHLGANKCPHRAQHGDQKSRGETPWVPWSRLLMTAMATFTTTSSCVQQKSLDIWPFEPPGTYKNLNTALQHGIQTTVNIHFKSS